MENIDEVKYEDIIDWLQYHETAWKDAMSYFQIEVEMDDSEESNTDKEYNALLQNVDKEDVVDWISEHEQLFDDFMSYFLLNEWTSVRFSAEDCDDYTMQDLEDAIDEFVFDSGYQWTGCIDVERSEDDDGNEFVSIGFDFNHDGKYNSQALEDTIREVFEENNVEWDEYVDCESVTDRYL